MAVTKGQGGAMGLPLDCPLADRLPRLRTRPNASIAVLLLHDLRYPLAARMGWPRKLYTDVQIRSHPGEFGTCYRTVYGAVCRAGYSRFAGVCPPAQSYIPWANNSQSYLLYSVHHPDCRHDLR